MYTHGRTISGIEAALPPVASWGSRKSRRREIARAIGSGEITSYGIAVARGALQRPRVYTRARYEDAIRSCARTYHAYLYISSFSRLFRRSPLSIVERLPTHVGSNPGARGEHVRADRVRNRVDRRGSPGDPHLSLSRELPPRRNAIEEFFK